MGVHSTVGEHKLKKKLKNCMGKECNVQFSVNQELWPQFLFL